MTSEKWIMISFADKNTFSGYLALPPAGTGPGLVLIQEIWGVNDHIRAVAEQYALDGFVVLAPDVFWRQQTRTNLDLAGQISQPILFHYAGLDELIPASAVDQVRKAFDGQENANIHNYEGVDHGFNCWGRPAYNQRAAALAHGRTLTFLATNLGIG